MPPGLSSRVLLTRFFMKPTHTEAMLKDAPVSYDPDLIEPIHMEAVFQDPDFEDPARIPPALPVLKNINLDFSRVYNL